MRRGTKVPRLPNAISASGDGSARGAGAGEEDASVERKIREKGRVTERSFMVVLGFTLSCLRKGDAFMNVLRVPEHEDSYICEGLYAE
jgi:hypothetical protein